MRPNVPTLPTLLKNAGYCTGIIGKLHVAPENAFAFKSKHVSTADTCDLKKVRARCDAFLDDSAGQSFFLMPTFLELSSATPPAGLPGRSLLPLLRGQPVKWREMLATEYTTHEPRNLNPQRSIRDARYKLTTTLLKDPVFQWPAEVPLGEYRKIQRRAATGEFIEFYDLKNDPYEFKNLAGQPEVKTEQDRLFNELLKWRQENQDPLLDLAALRAMVMKEKDAPPTPIPAWRKEQEARRRKPQ